METVVALVAALAAIMVEVTATPIPNSLDPIGGPITKQYKHRKTKIKQEEKHTTFCSQEISFSNAIKSFFFGPITSN